jgi:carboxymethylproline synthase
METRVNRSAENSKYSSYPGLYLTHLQKQWLWVQFDHNKETNPFSRKLTLAITDLNEKLNHDDSVFGVVFYGGPQRSFSAGGDFNDVSQLRTAEETDLYISEIINLYQSVLKINKPVISVLDNYVIGQGLQVALMSDWRIASENVKISMSELKNGVACPLGATILKELFGQARMLEDVVGCETFDADVAFKKGYFNTLVKSEDLIKATATMIDRLQKYPQTPFKETKKIYTKAMIDALENVRKVAAHAHIQTMFAGSAQTHFDRILKKG